MMIYDSNCYLIIIFCAKIQCDNLKRIYIFNAGAFRKSSYIDYCEHYSIMLTQFFVEFEMHSLYNFRDTNFYLLPYHKTCECI